MDGPERPRHYSDIEEAERAAWDMLVRGALSRKSAFHQVTVATVGPDGLPEARTVVLRQADRAGKHLRFNTDVRSAKYASLMRAPQCTLLFYDHGAKVQVRVRGAARLKNGCDECRSVWNTMREMSKECYRQKVGPGAALTGPAGAEGDLLDDEEGFHNFALVPVAVARLEWLYLAAAGHRRAEFTYGDGVGRRWIAP
ncbi:MAG: pyridoxamine 5'-phosphate oxidase family protein [Pseudomonadota bacterium]